MLTARSRYRLMQKAASPLFCLMFLQFLTGCAPSPSQLEQIVARGELRVATRNGPTSYFIDRDGATGIEYEMARRFARQLNVRLRVITARHPGEVIELVATGKADLAAAALPRRLVQDADLAAGRSYHWVTYQIVYRNGLRRPDSLDDVFPDRIHLARGSIPEALLEELQRRHPSLGWTVHEDKDVSTLLEMLEAGRIAYTVVQSNELAHVRQVRPEIRAALNLSEPEPLVWAVRDGEDRSLLHAVDRFMMRLEKGGTLGELLARFYGPVESFDYVESREFMARVESRLPLYRAAFERAADEFNIDWRLLAAMAYQESHWSPGARSPTGVRGLMMLTIPTAQRVGVRNRLDPLESVRGGALYLAELKQRLPERIREPDRTWMALAAYNVGLGHLEDARVLTQRQGRDPDRWAHVREHLPLLSNSNWYKTTKHGYARGYEPVKFVRRVRSFYAALVQITQPELPESQQLVEAAITDSPVL